MCFGRIPLIRTLCDANYEEDESHLRAYLDISLKFVIPVTNAWEKRVVQWNAVYEGDKLKCYYYPGAPIKRAEIINVTDKCS